MIYIFENFPSAGSMITWHMNRSGNCDSLSNKGKRDIVTSSGHTGKLTKARKHACVHIEGGVHFHPY